MRDFYAGMNQNIADTLRPQDDVSEGQARSNAVKFGTAAAAIMKSSDNSGIKDWFFSKKALILCAAAVAAAGIACLTVHYVRRNRERKNTQSVKQEAEQGRIGEKISFDELPDANKNKVKETREINTTKEQKLCAISIQK